MATAASPPAVLSSHLDGTTPPLPSAASPDAVAQPVDAGSPVLSDTTLTDDPPSRPHPPKRLSLDVLRRSISRAQHDNHDPSERPVSHEARVLYALITGSIPPSPPPSKAARVFLPKKQRDGRRVALPPTVSVVSLATIAEPEVSDVRAVKGGKPTMVQKKKKREEESWPVPNVKPKALKKLKADLLKADKARAIVADLKRMEPPVATSSTSSPSSELPIHSQASRGYALPPLSDPAVPSDSASAPPISSSPSTSSTPPAISSNATPPGPSPADPPYVTFDLPTLASLPPTSVGGLTGLAAARTGMFEVLADASGALIAKSGVHDTMSFSPPLDRVSVLLWWWGYEITVPPPAIRVLQSVASVQQSFFTFLQAFVAAGGAPELAPFVRYISSYADMEWKAIQAQNRGNGVVLAATWLLPIALVPRPWDFAL
ncbi:hypothetical protein JCM8547_006828 [Rhodosporidiobolus lusitaniae]